MKNSMVFLKYSQDLCLEFKTNHTHCFCWECIPYLSLFVLMFCRGYEFPQTERVSPFSGETRKTKAGLCQHCLKMVWSNSNMTKPGWNHCSGENKCPVWQMGRWAPPRTDRLCCLQEGNPQTPHPVWPMSAAGSPSSPLHVLWFCESSATFFYVSWPAFCQLKLRLFFPSFLCNSRIICTHTLII